MDMTPYLHCLENYPSPPTILVIHHTASTGDEDITVWNQQHIAEGWCCFGAHACIRKMADPNNANMSEIQYGRPITKIGAQAYSINTISIGVETNGNFVIETPSQLQINALVYLL